MCMYVQYMSAETHRGQKGNQILWSWSYKGLWTALWEVGTEPVSSTRVVGYTNYGAISPSMSCLFEIFFSYYIYPLL